MTAPEVPSFQRGGGFGTLGTSFEQPKLPAPISWTPSTWGAYVTLGLFALALLGLVALGVRSYRRRAPRRLALRRIAALDRSSASLPTVAALLKSVALDSFGRRRVATLSGKEWRAFLVATAPTVGFEGPAGDALITLGERGVSAISSSAVEPLFAASAAWIREHTRSGAP